MAKPLTHRLIASAIKAIGEEKFTLLLERSMRIAIKSPFQRPVMERILNRVLSFGGKKPSRREIDEICDKIAGLHAHLFISLMAMDRERAARLGQEVELEALPALNELLARGSGAILVSPHFGNLFIAKAALAMAGVKLNLLFINADSYRHIEGPGLRLHNLGEGALPLMSALKNNEVVMLETDMDYFPGGRTSDLFGAPVRPPHGPARLSMASGAPILPVYLVREEGRCHLRADEPIVPGEKDQTVIEASIQRSMERWIGRYPDHWYLTVDIWDLETCDRIAKRHLRGILAYKRLLGFFTPLRRFFMSLRGS